MSDDVKVLDSSEQTAASKARPGFIKFTDDSNNAYISGLLLSGLYKWDFGTGAHVLNYYLADSNNQSWTSQEKTAFANAMQQYSNVANLQFVAVDSADQASLVEYLDKTVNGAYHYVPDGTASNAQLEGRFHLLSKQTNQDILAGSYDANTFIHEIGHGLGLKHPFDKDGNQQVFPGGTDGDYQDLGDFSDIHTMHTAMAYASGYSFDAQGRIVLNSNFYVDNQYDYGYMNTLSPLDIQVIQYLYGANTSYKSGDDVYTLPDSGPQAGTSTYWTTIYDTGGVDEIRYDGARNAFIDLRAATGDHTDTGGGVFSQVANEYGGFTIAKGTVIERGTGGSGNDVIVGNQVANVLTGNAGSDTLTGGGGFDVFKDSTVNHNGDKITDFSMGNDIWVTDGVVSSFSFLYNAATGVLSFTNSAITSIMSLSAGLMGLFGKTQDSAGGIDLELYNAPTLAGVNTTVTVADHAITTLNPGASLADSSLDQLNNGMGNYAGASVTVGRDGAASADDVFGFAGNPDFTAAAGTLTATATGTAFGTYSYSGGLLTINFTSSATVATSTLVNDVLKSITYEDSADTSSATVKLDYNYTGPSGAGFVASGQTTVDVTAAIGSSSSGGGGGGGGSTYSTTPTPGPDFLTVAAGGAIAALAGDDTIIGGGNNLLFGNQGNDTITDGSGQNTVYGGQDNDLITVGDGNNLLFGNEGSDTIRTGNGNNTVVGGNDSTDGADVITAGTGNDLILGNGGNDTVAAGAGNDSVVGGFGADVLLGNAGNDLLLGNQGDDTLFGGQGSDTLYGGQGNDLLYGNQGDDVLYGNQGSNRFVFNPGDTDFKFGTSTGDTIADFKSGTDRIDFASGPVGTALNFGSAQTASTDFASIQALAQTLLNSGDAYAFVSDGTDGFLFTTGGSGTTIADAIKLAGAGTTGAVKYTDIAHGALA